jgi:hypothetical protein
VICAAGQLWDGGSGEAQCEVDPEADDGGWQDHLRWGAVQALRLPAADSGGLQTLGRRGGVLMLASPPPPLRVLGVRFGSNDGLRRDMQRSSVKQHWRQERGWGGKGGERGGGGLKPPPLACNQKTFFSVCRSWGEWLYAGRKGQLRT